MLAVKELIKLLQCVCVCVCSNTFSYNWTETNAVYVCMWERQKSGICRNVVAPQIFQIG